MEKLSLDFFANEISKTATYAVPYLDDITKVCNELSVNNGGIKFKQLSRLEKLKRLSELNSKTGMLATMSKFISNQIKTDHVLAFIRSCPSSDNVKNLLT